MWIGAYRLREKLYRVVLNGQTGTLTGKAPISWVKVLVALAIGLGAIGCLIGAIMLIGVLSS